MARKRQSARTGSGRTHVAQRPAAAVREQIRAVKALLDGPLSELRVTVRRTLAVMTVAVLEVIGSVRSGQGRLSLCALARTMPTGTAFKAQYKRLGRFLTNKHFTPEAMVPALVNAVVGSCRRGLVPILFDQVDIGGVPTLMAGVSHHGRVLPIAFSCWEHARLRRSQNTLETAFLTLILASLGREARAVFVGDRQYGRFQLLHALNRLGQLYVLRCKSEVILWHEGQERFPKDFAAPRGQAVRYARVGYRKKGKEPVDLIVYHEPSYKEPWYLLVPSGSEALLPTKKVVALYRSRMRIEQGFRDWKTHLGVRGLELKVDKAVRLGRLLLALTLAYIALVVLGASSWAERQRPRFERLRHTARHGTRQTLSVLTLARWLLACAALAAKAHARLLQVFYDLASGTPAYTPEAIS